MLYFLVVSPKLPEDNKFVMWGSPQSNKFKLILKGWQPSSNYWRCPEGMDRQAGMAVGVQSGRKRANLPRPRVNNPRG